MFSAVLTFISTNIGDVFDLIGDIITGSITIFYDSVGTALTDAGELMLPGALVGLAWFGLRWLMSLIPFAKA